MYDPKLQINPGCFFLHFSYCFRNGSNWSNFGSTESNCHQLNCILKVVKRNSSFTHYPFADCMWMNKAYAVFLLDCMRETWRNKLKGYTQNNVLPVGVYVNLWEKVEWKCIDAMLVFVCKVWLIYYLYRFIRSGRNCLGKMVEFL